MLLMFSEPAIWSSARSQNTRPILAGLSVTRSTYAANASASCGALIHGWCRSRLATDAATNSAASACVTARR